MNTIPRTMMLCAALVLTACKEAKPDGRESALAAENAALKKSILRSEVKIGRLAGEKHKLECDLETERNRVELAKDEAELYQRLLDRSNTEKLERARELLREARGH